MRGTMTRQNNFDALRFWAAVAVLWSHAFPLGEAIQDPLTVLTHGQTSIGSMAVAVFFVISGYLITWSYKRTDAPRRFAATDCRCSVNIKSAGRTIEDRHD